jgi:hypothetical protein
MTVTQPPTVPFAAFPNQTELLSMLNVVVYLLVDVKFSIGPKHE